MSSELKVNTSWLKRHRQCPAQAHYEYVLKRIPDEDKAVALDAGSLFHKAMDLLHGPPNELGETWNMAQVDEEITRMLGAGEIGLGGYDEWCESLRLVAKEWTPPSDWEFLATEKEYEVTLPNGIVCRGILDSVIRWNGKIWHGQYKTTHASTKEAVYAEIQRTDWHECVYHRMLQNAYPSDIIGGTILILVKKLSAKRVSAAPLAGLTLWYLDRSDEVVANALVDMAMETNTIIQEMKSVRRVTRDPQQCGGPYKNRLCPYREVCVGTEDINGKHFRTAEDRYEASASPGEDA
jgi:hypothetical protein